MKLYFKSGTFNGIIIIKPQNVLNLSQVCANGSFEILRNHYNTRSTAIHTLIERNIQLKKIKFQQTKTNCEKKL